MFLKYSEFSVNENYKYAIEINQFLSFHMWHDTSDLAPMQDVYTMELQFSLNIHECALITVARFRKTQNTKGTGSLGMIQAER